MKTEPLVLPFESGPILPKRCWVCTGVILRPHPVGVRYTYAMQREGWIKIGMTGNVRERLSVLSRATEGCLVVHPAEMDWRAPITLLAVVVGDVEHELHDRFAHSHAIGEWFHPSEHLSNWIDTHRGELPCP